MRSESTNHKHGVPIWLEDRGVLQILNFYSKQSDPLPSNNPLHVRTDIVTCTWCIRSRNSVVVSCACVKLMIFNTLRPRQNGRYIRKRHFQTHFLEWKLLSFVLISVKYVPSCSIINMPALVQMMAWHRTSDKPLSEPSLPAHICVNRPLSINRHGPMGS